MPRLSSRNAWNLGIAFAIVTPLCFLLFASNDFLTCSASFRVLKQTLFVSPFSAIFRRNLFA